MLPKAKSKVWVTDATRHGCHSCPRRSDVFVFLSSAQRGSRVSQSPPAEAGLELAWGKRFPQQWSVCFLPFGPYFSRTWSTLTQGRDLLPLFWPEAKFSVAPWGKQKSSSSSFSWKGWRQLHWKGRSWDAGVEKESIRVRLTVTWLVWCVFCRYSSGSQHYNIQVCPQREWLHETLCSMGLEALWLDCLKIV